MPEIQTDYLIVGAGAVGMAFADTLLSESDAHITIVDRRGKPGGHWNDAYPFVSLHQPSAFYGVNSALLGSGEIDAVGTNKGYYELASGSEVNSYFERIMQHRFIPSGRVSYYPMTDYLGDGRFVSLLSGQETHADIRCKTVDATYYGSNIPATHTRKFAVEGGVHIIPPNNLPQLWMGGGARPDTFVILGAGKTAMDVGVWLLRSGANPEDIIWVCPRDSWLLNRHHTQPGEEFFEATMGGQAAIMEALAQSATTKEAFERLESSGVMLRIDPAQSPSMFHYATISKAEIALLAGIKNVVRMGRVQSVDMSGMHMLQGHFAVGGNPVYIDCTATAVERRPAVPVFQDDRITLQMIRVPQPTFSAAVTAFIETAFDDDAAKNALSKPVPLPDDIAQYPAATMVNMINQMAWMQNEKMRDWIVNSRLDAFGKMIANVRPDETSKIAILQQFRANAAAAAANIPKLMAQA